MVFSSPLFLFVFLPAAMLATWLAPWGARNAVVVAASLLFYGWGEPRFIFVVLASAAADHLAALRIAADGRAARYWLWAGVSGNLAILGWFKYAGFAAATLAGPAAAVGIALPAVHVLLPIGVSFIVFEKISYLVDVSRRTVAPACTFQEYLIFVFLYPKLLAGPILKYHEINRQFSLRGGGWEDRMMGFRRFLWGLAKKVLVADVCSEVVDAVFALPAQQVGCRSAWLAMAAFTVQIYFDFSGYSDMAIGLARMIGFRLRENFDNPYVASSFSEFWRRWHISLTTWIRSYLYIPLGGSRGGRLRTAANLWICFLLSGLWHGAAWTFLLWGTYNGLFLILDRLFWLRVAARLPPPAARAATLLAVMVGWLLFRSTSLAQFAALAAALVSPDSDGTWIYLRAHQAAAIALPLGACGVLLGTPWFTRLRRRFLAAPGGRATADLAVAALGVAAIAKVVAVTFHPFLYFRF